MTTWRRSRIHANNPALLAVVEAHRLQVHPTGILSLSTGETCTPIDPGKAKRRGTLTWVRDIITIGMDGQSDVAHQALMESLPHDYIRTMWRVPGGVEMDSADRVALAALQACGIEVIARDGMKIVRAVAQWGKETARHEV